MKRNCVIYYSRTGKTRAAAEAVAEKMDTDIFEIKDLKSRSGILGFISGIIDVKKSGITEISPETIDLSGYEFIFIGSPCWGMKFAPAITTFLENIDLAGKKVVLFSTANGHIKPKTFDIYTDKVKSKGGSVVGHFFLLTFFKNPPKVKQKTKELLESRTDSWTQS
jgi:flavodoxin